LWQRQSPAPPSPPRPQRTRLVGSRGPARECRRHGAEAPPPPPAAPRCLLLLHPPSPSPTCPPRAPAWQAIPAESRRARRLKHRRAPPWKTLLRAPAAAAAAAAGRDGHPGAAQAQSGTTGMSCPAPRRASPRLQAPAADRMGVARAARGPHCHSGGRPGEIQPHCPRSAPPTHALRPPRAFSHPASASHRPGAIPRAATRTATAITRRFHGNVAGRIPSAAIGTLPDTSPPRPPHPSSRPALPAPVMPFLRRRTGGLRWENRA
jgi:hypothetical protein